MPRLLTPSARRVAALSWLCGLLVLLPACETARVAERVPDWQAGRLAPARTSSPEEVARGAPRERVVAAPLPPVASPRDPREAERASSPPSSADGVAAAAVPSPLGTEAEAATTAALPRAPRGPASPVPPRPVEPVRIALLLPLSGASGPIGEELLAAAQIALFDAADENFVLLPFDTEGTPEGAERAATAALGEGVRLILGPLYAASVARVAPLARARAVPVVAFSNDSTVAGDGVYIMGFMPADHVERVVVFARSRGIERFAALAPDTDYGREIVREMRRAAEEHGGTMGRVEYYDPAAADVSDVVRRLADYDRRRTALANLRQDLQSVDEDWARRELEKLKDRETVGEVDYDAVLLPEGGERLRAIAPLLLYYDADAGGARLLGTGQWDDPTLGSEPALEGGWFAASPPPARARFERRYKETYGRAPLRLASLAYDAVALAVRLAQREGGADFSPAAILSPSGFVGYDGLFRFRATGLVERGLAVLEVWRRGFRVVSPAREAFGE